MTRAPQVGALLLALCLPAHLAPPARGEDDTRPAADADANTNATADADDNDAAAAARFTLTVRKDDDVVTAADEDGAAVLHVTCPGGIGGVKVELADGAEWPERIVVRLSGFTTLEGFDAGNGEVRVHTALGAEREEIRRAAGDGKWDDQPYDEKYATPVEQGEGYIEVTLPPALWADGADFLEVEWVDAYRG